MFAFIGFATLFAIVGVLLNQTKLVQVLFASGDKRVVIESSQLHPRGTYFELYRGNKRVIGKTEISDRPIKASEIDTYKIDASGKLMAYHCDHPEPDGLDILLLVDFENDAYAIYWAGCRADKCKKLGWNTWDERSTNFANYLNDLKN